MPVRITSSLMSARVSERERGREPFNVRFSPLCLITSMNNEYFDFRGSFFFFSRSCTTKAIESHYINSSNISNTTSKKSYK